MKFLALASHRNPWHHRAMPKPSREKRDFMQVAREVVERAIGEKMDGAPLDPPPPDTRNPHAVALGKIGGEKGGRARAEALSPAKRRAIAKKAAQSRWKRKGPVSGA